MALENLRGELKRLDTVVRMSMAEQRRINTDFFGALTRQAGQTQACDRRLDKLQTKLAAYTGGLMAIWLVFQILRTFLR